MVEAKGGRASLGDCEITASYDDRARWDDMIKNKTKIIVDGIEVRPKLYTPSSLRTKIKILCERINEQ